MRARPSAVHNDLALQFARIVSVAVSDENSKVYRNGQHSLFSIFAKCCRGAAQEEGSRSRETLSNTRFNKVLEKDKADEFIKVRDREQGAEACDKDSELFTGSYVFTHRRWRDPTDPADCEALVSGYKALVARYQGSRYEFVQEDVFLHSVWRANVDAERRRREDASGASDCSRSSISSAPSPSPPHSVPATRSSSCAPETPPPTTAMCGSKRKSAEQADWYEPERSPKQSMSHFLFRALPDLEDSPSVRESIVESNMPSESTLAAAKDLSLQKLMACWEEWDAAELAAQTAVILEHDPME
eukprot:3154717-Rhodomonas_salina.1